MDQKNQAVTPLSIPFKTDVYHPVVVGTKDYYYLIDAGHIDTFHSIKKQLETIEYPLSGLKGVVLTHQDLDHVGGLPQVVAYFGENLPLYAYGADVPVINGAQSFLKLPEAAKATFRDVFTEQVVQQFEDFYSGNQTNIPKENELQQFKEVPGMPGLEIIPTPGHTPGHMSLYHRPSATLITGDALVASEGKLMAPVKAYTPDYPEAIASLNQFLALPFEEVVCYHGGLVSGGDIREQLVKIIAAESFGR